MAANKKILIEVSVRETGSKAVGDAASKAVKDLSKLTEEEKRNRIEADKLKITNADLAASFREQAAAELAAANNGKPFRAQAGLNNAILLETSRLASDAGYGFTAIANNLSQVISLFFSFSKTAGSVRAALGQLGKSIMGTGGLLIAVQLLIAFGPKIVDFFRGGAKAAEEFKKKLDDLTKSLDEQISLFDMLSSSFFDYNLSGQALSDTASILENRFSKFNTGMEKLRKQGLDKNDESIGNLVKSFGRLLDVEKEIIEVSEKYKKRLEEDGGETERSIQLRGRFKELIRELIELQKLFTLEQEKGTSTTKRYKREFLRFTEEIQAARKALIQSLIDDKQDEIALVGEAEKEKLRIEFNSFIERQKQRLSEGRITQQMYYDSEIQAAQELDRALFAIRNKTAALQSQNAIEEMTKANEMERLRFQELARIGLDARLMDERNAGIRAKKRLDLEQDLLLKNIEYKKAELNNDRLTALEKAKLQAEITAMEKKESDIRTKIALAEQQAKVQTFEVTANALSAFGELVGKETKAGKALAVSSALISTYLSAQKAYESQFMPLALVDSPVRGAIAAAAAIASGLANVKAIISEGKSKPSTTAGRPQVEAPDFNVVGASPESQLAQTVAGQQAKPIKAFVVGKEITSQQELDRNILTTAGLGD